MEDPITVHRETVIISGDRPLYMYTFELDGEPMPEMEEKLGQIPIQPT